jgi:hypothetical protein
LPAALRKGSAVLVERSAAGGLLAGAALVETTRCADVEPTDVSADAFAPLPLHCAVVGASRTPVEQDEQR